MNTIENIIISAVNEYEGAYNVKDLDEATDVLSYEGLLLFRSNRLDTFCTRYKYIYS